MGSKWYKGRFGIESIAPSSEFEPRKYKARVFDLRKSGVPTVPVVGQTSYRRLGEPSPWHVHEQCIEFVYCAAGSCEYESKGRRYRLQPGMMFVSREDEEHRQLDCPKGYATFYLLFKPSANAAGRWFESALAKLPRLFLCGRSVPVRFGRIISLAEGGRTGQELKIRLQTEVNALFLDVLDSACVATGKRGPKVLDEIAERMRRNPEEDYPLSELVAESGLSTASFMALFKAAQGCSPHAYHLLCRVEAAKTLLGNGVPTKEIVERLGFNTSRNLVRTFKNFVGLSPRQWCARNRS